MSIQNLISYEVLGTKEDFAGWVSNISPYETPFVSLTGKAPVYNKVFEWQTDRLQVVQNNAWQESHESLPTPILIATEPQNNYTQILRKVVQVSDTANAQENYGRTSELEYQIEKATKEIKRDLESIFLSDQEKDEGDSVYPRQMSAFLKLTADVDEVEPTTGAVVHRKLDTDTFTEDDIFNITENLYYAGSRANVIMFHPSNAPMFNNLFAGNGGGRVEVYMNDDHEVPNMLTEVVDPLGQKYTLLPNRFIDKYVIYFFHPHDWFQRVLRKPTVSFLDKTGSNENWMLEMEVGLQHRNRFASGILELKYTPPNYNFSIDSTQDLWVGSSTYQMTYTSAPDNPQQVVWFVNDTSIADINPITGVLTIKGEGSATVSATATYYKGVQAQATRDVFIVPTVLVSSQTSGNVSILKTLDVSKFLVLAPQAANDAGFTYSSSDVTKATVDVNGIVTGVDETSGTPVVITITSKADPSFTVGVNLDVNAVPHTVNIIPSARNVIEGEVVDYTIDIDTDTATSVDITSEDESFVKISDKVKVDDKHWTFKATTLKPGTKSIGVKIEFPDGEYNGSDSVTAREFNFAFTTSTPLPSNAAPAAYQLNVTSSTRNVTNADCDWSSSNNSFATLSTTTKGLVEYVGAGTGNITVHYVVNPNVTKVISKPFTVVATTVDFKEDSSTNPPSVLPHTGGVGDTQKYLLHHNVDSGSDTGVIGVMNPTITWSSSDTSVATIGSNGLLTMLKIGTTNVKATLKLTNSITGLFTTVDTPTVAVNVVDLQLVYNGTSPIALSVGGTQDIMYADISLVPSSATMPNLSLSTADSEYLSVTTVGGQDKIGTITALKETTTPVKFSITAASNSAATVEVPVNISMPHGLVVTTPGLSNPIVCLKGTRITFAYTWDGIGSIGALINATGDIGSEGGSSSSGNSGELHWNTDTATETTGEITVIFSFTGGQHATLHYPVTLT